MKNVNFHIDDTVTLQIRELRGELLSNAAGMPPLFDDKHSYTLAVQTGELAVSTDSLTDLINRYVLSVRNSSLKQVRITTEGLQIKQTGVVRRAVQIPFSIVADADVTPAGKMRLRPDKRKMVGIPAKGLMNFFGLKLEDLVELDATRGLTVEGDDLIVDPARLLPAPGIRGRLVRIGIDRGQIVQVFGSGRQASRLDPLIVGGNYMNFQGGVLGFGKLTMTDADLQIVDADSSDPFDFYPDHYHEQLVAGYSKTTPRLGLEVFMPDYDEIGSARGLRSGGSH